MVSPLLWTISVIKSALQVVDQYGIVTVRGKTDIVYNAILILGMVNSIDLKPNIVPNGICGHPICQNNRGLINLIGSEEYVKDFLERFRIGNLLASAAARVDSICVASEVVCTKGNNIGVILTILIVYVKTLNMIMGCLITYGDT